MPDAPWQLFDPQGFAAFRIGMITLASCALIAVFGLSALFLPTDWALLAFLIAATAPFTIHEVYFTWPELLAAAFTLQAAYLTFRSRFVWAGMILGLGYLAHPSAVLWFPALAAIIFLRVKPHRTGVWAVRVLFFGAGLATFLMLWLLLNRGNFAQNFFLSYFGMTSTYSPFGVGIAFFCSYLVRAIWIASSKAAAWLWVVFPIPLLLFVMYWGMSSGGLTREGLHAWVLGLLIFCVVIWLRFPRFREPYGERVTLRFCSAASKLQPCCYSRPSGRRRWLCDGNLKRPTPHRLVERASGRPCRPVR